ncbi:MAG: hypothetical protein E6Y39_06225 [Clostridium butyricum]|nr:hypothetical protein [Clostridium butyricum]
MAEKKQNSKIEFYTEYTVKNAIKNGDKYTKLSMFILGAGNFARKEFVKGVLFLLSEFVFIFEMIASGCNALYMLTSLGSNVTGEVFNEKTQVYEYVQGDNSMLILLYGVVTIFVIMGFIIIWRANIKSAYKSQLKKEKNEHI